MIEIETKYFGRIAPDAGLVFEFPLGLPAFERERAFLAIELPRTAPLIMLQSISTPDLCFLTLPISEVHPGYHVQISAEDRSILGLDELNDGPAGPDLAVLALVAVGKDGRISVNLMAPVVVNRANRRAVQSVRWDGAYSHEHPLSPPPAEAGAQEQPCS
jgi:flagellar assembly factor FliW